MTNVQNRVRVPFLCRRTLEDNRLPASTPTGFDGLLEPLPKHLRETDLPIAGLLKDLKRRDMLKGTLVI